MNFRQTVIYYNKKRKDQTYTGISSIQNKSGNTLDFHKILEIDATAKIMQA
jgi:hypothetical protein